MDNKKSMVSVTQVKNNRVFMPGRIIIPKIPCKTCGDPTPMLGTKLCDGCWEVESRLPSYMKSKKGRQFVVETLNQELKRILEHEYQKED